MAGRKPQQRIVELKVAEVSLVDDPANEEEFLVIKSRGGSDMATRTKDTAAPTAVADNDKAPATEGQETTTEVQEGVVQGNAPVKAPADGVEGDGESTTQQSDAGPGNADAVATATAGAPSGDTNTQLAELQKQVENLAAALGPPTLSLGDKEEKPKEGDEEKPKKDGEEEGKETKEASMVSIQTTLNEIRDGLQALTQASGITKEKPKEPVKKGTADAERIKWRSDRVREATGIMMEILHDMDYDMAQALMKSIGDGKEKTPPATGNKPVTKEEPAPEKEPPATEDAVMAAVEKQVAPIREQVTSLLETIKNVRGVGNAEGTDSTEEPQETIKSLWGGKIAPPGMFKR